jgi:hypothetical protein
LGAYSQAYLKAAAKDKLLFFVLTRNLVALVGSVPKVDKKTCGRYTANDLDKESRVGKRSARVSAASALIEIVNKEGMAVIVKGELPLAVAHQCGVPYVSVKVTNAARTKVSGGFRLGNLVLYHASEVRQRSVTLTPVNSRGTKLTSIPISSDDDEEDDKDDEEDVNQYETGYWLSTWNINDLGEALGSHGSFRGALALDEFLVSMRSCHAGLHFAVVNTERSRSMGLHWVSASWFKGSNGGASSRLNESLSHTAYSAAIKKVCRKERVDCNVVVQKWQRDGWRCGYFLFWDAFSGANTAHTRKKSVEDLQSRKAMKMPTGFEGLVWLILEGIRLAQDVALSRADLLDLLECSDARPITRKLLDRLQIAKAPLHEDLVDGLIADGV